MTQTPYLDVALDAISAAEKITKKHFGNIKDVEFKNDKTPVTVADQETEAVILDILKKAFPDHGYLGEESGLSENKSEYLWIIDPIDGTNNFLRKSPLYGTLIALMKNNEVILGVSHMPQVDELMYAVKGEGTFINGQRVKVSDVETIEESFITYEGLRYFDRTNTIDGLSALIPKCKTDRGDSSCFTYHLIASGRGDAHISPYTKIWDVAPAKICIEEAGGSITDMNGEVLRVDSTSCIASNGKIHNLVCSHF